MHGCSGDFWYPISAGRLLRPPLGWRMASIVDNNVARCAYGGTLYTKNRRSHDQREHSLKQRVSKL